MDHHQTPDFKDCPCCNGQGAVANADCCSACNGTARLLAPPTIAMVGGSHEFSEHWYVRRAAVGFPHGPGSLYLHRDGNWHPATINNDGEFTGLYPTRTLAATHLDAQS